MFPVESSTSWHDPAVAARAIGTGLDRLGLERIGDVFMVPYRRVSRKGYQRGAAEIIRVGRRHTTDDGRDVFVRTHTGDFNLVPIAWVARGSRQPRQVYAIGPGLDGAPGNTLATVLQCQCFTPSSGLAGRLLDAVAPHVTASEVSDADEYGLPCLRISAILRDAALPALWWDR